ncbi:MAG: hypothetical protein GX489_08190, partial [Firmicutes bacterium]|nr:hypothetical protein [Bacillota bacterium]
MSNKTIGRTVLILTIFIAIIAGTVSAAPVLKKPAARKPAAIGQRESARELEKEISDYITNKGTTYDFANDHNFLDLVNAFAPALLKPESEYFLDHANHFAVGDLDKDNLPEIAVYEQRNFDSIDDSGALVVYQFKDGQYQQIAHIDMEYDNTCIKMANGPAAPGQNALFMQTAVGAHSEMFYLFLLQDGKLEPAID